MWDFPAYSIVYTAQEHIPVGAVWTIEYTGKSRVLKLGMCQNSGFGPFLIHSCVIQKKIMFDLENYAINVWVLTHFCAFL